MLLRKIWKCWLNSWVVFAAGGDGIAAAAADGVFAAGDDDDDDGSAVTAADVSGDVVRGAAAVGSTDGDAGIIDDAATYFYKENLRFI